MAEPTFAKSTSDPVSSTSNPAKSTVLSDFWSGFFYVLGFVAIAVSLIYFPILTNDGWMFMNALQHVLPIAAAGLVLLVVGRALYLLAKIENNTFNR